MTLSLRQLSRSRRLRAICVLAWLMLVVQSLTAMPMLGNTHQALHHQSSNAAMVMGASCVHHQTAAMSRHCCDGIGGCCGGLVGGACGCAVMASSALPSASLNVLLSTLRGVVYTVQQGPGAPAVNRGAPLRPPAV